MTPLLDKPHPRSLRSHSPYSDRLRFERSVFWATVALAALVYFAG